jgi:UDP-N-acetylmuramate dehydrogenase
MTSSVGDLSALSRALGPAARAQEPLARYTSIRVGGPADLFFSARTTEALASAVSRAAEMGVPWRVIGGASNLLIADEGMEGLVVRAATTNTDELPDVAPNDVLIRADAGCMLAAVGKQAALRGLRGLEWAVNVPGTVGASVVNNSGAFGSNVSEHIVSASVHIPGMGTSSLGAEELGHDYRTSRLKRGEIVGVVLDATYRLRRDDVTALRARIAEIQRVRRQTQPSGYSVGSVFANPPGDSSGRLIEATGLKGFRIGDAEVSALHANFIINRGGARARDVLGLMKHVQSAVWQQHGVWLKPEVQLAGRFDPADTGPLYAAPGAEG